MRRLLPGPPGDEVDLLDAYLPPTDRPHVRANMVTSADGAAQAPNGRSAGLSSRADQQLFALLRDLADVILVGAETVRVEKFGPVQPDQERVARRRAAGLSGPPPIAVVSGDLALDPASAFFTEAEVRPLVFTTDASPADRRRRLAGLADVVVAGTDRVELGRAVDALVDRGLRRILCEGGPRLLAQLVAAGRLDELCLTISPLLLAGPAIRILNGPLLATPARLRLAQLLEEDGFLFARFALR